MSLISLLSVILVFVAHGDFGICARSFPRGALNGGPSGQATHISTPTPSAPACRVITETDNSIRRHVDVKKSFAGNLITVTVDQHIQPNNLSNDFLSSDLKIGVRIGAQELISTHTTLNPNGSNDGSIFWGSLVHGADTAKFNINNGTVSGNVDDRQFHHFNHRNNVTGVTFVDGGHPPALHAAPNISHALQGLDQLVVHALDSCEVAAPPINGAAPSAHLMSRSSATSSCTTCKVGATAAVAAAELSCVLRTCWWSSARCVACTAAAATAETKAVASCEFSHACCNAADICGSKCCNPTKAPGSAGPDLGLLFCADPVKEVCCFLGNKAIDGVCCAPGSTTVCDGECCTESCGADGKCHLHITDEECFAKG